jgi:hypothetical protein
MTSSHRDPRPGQGFARLAAGLDRRSAPRFVLQLLGAVLARVRRTVTTWIRAIGLGRRSRPCDTTAAAAPARSPELRRALPGGLWDRGHGRRAEADVGILVLGPVADRL